MKLFGNLRAFGIFFFAIATLLIAPAPTTFANPVLPAGTLAIDSVPLMAVTATGSIKEFRLWSGSSIMPDETSALIKRLSSLAADSPTTSYVTVIRYETPSFSRVHVRVSDGMTYYAAGAGSTLHEALTSLVISPEALATSS